MTFNICIRNNEFLQDQEFEVAGGKKVDLTISAGVYGYQIIVIFFIVVLVDWYITTGFMRLGET